MFPTLAVATTTALMCLVPTSTPQLSEKNQLIVKAIHYAEKYDVDAVDMIRIVNCESAQTWHPAIQSRHRKNGVREKSFGLSQIHLPSWTNIAYADAIDPDFALDFLAKKLSTGERHLWSCTRKMGLY